MRTRICVALPVRTFLEAVSKIQEAEKEGADLIEMRLDYLNSGQSIETNELREIVNKSSVPLIATNRQYGQGGFRLQNEEQRIRTLLRSAQAGFQHVDLEITIEKLAIVVQTVKNYGAKTIISFHDFKSTPSSSEMEEIVRTQIDVGGEICKLVTTAQDIADNIRCLLFTRKLSEKNNLICFAMGRKGILSRVLSPFFGAYFTYASLEDGFATAPGQMSIADLQRIYRELGVSE